MFQTKYRKNYKWFLGVLVCMIVLLQVPFSYAKEEGNTLSAIGFYSNLDEKDDITKCYTTHLKSNESIYIKFSSPIKITQETFSKIHITQFHTKDAFHWIVGSGGVSKSSDVKGEIQKQKIEVVEESVLKITPKEKWDEDSIYSIGLDQGALKDPQEKMLDHAIKTLFFVKSIKQPLPNWHVSNMIAKKIQKINDVPSLTYNVLDHQVISKNAPIHLSIEGKVRVKSDKIYLDSSGKVLSTDALKNITLEDGYDSKKKILIDSIETDFINYQGKMMTDLKIFPHENLNGGGQYKLIIPKDTFETIDNKRVEALTINLYIEPKILNKEIERLENNHYSVTDLHSGNKMFSIIGKNFHRRIKNVELKPYSGKASQSYTVDPKFINWIDDTKMNVSIEGNVKNELSKEGNVGAYEVYVSFDDSLYTQPDSVITKVYGKNQDDNKRFLYILSKGVPKERDPYPKSEDQKTWYDEKALKHDVIDDRTKGHSFIKVQFDDLDDQLTFMGLSRLESTIVRAIGGKGNELDVNFIRGLENEDVQKMKEDIERYIWVKQNHQVTLYIPVKNLRPQTTYDVMLPAGVAEYSDNGEENQGIEWKFTTTAHPQVQRVSIGSLPENYDTDEPIIIKGDFFNVSGDVRVYFDDMEAEDVEVIDQTQLRVYLPEGSDRLDEGVYDITIENDENHQNTIIGSLSIIKGGKKEHIPREDYFIKEDGSKGEIRGNRKISEDTLLLSPSDVNEKEVSIHLDEIMGTQVLTRNIEYDTEKRYTIGMLRTYSKWGDATLYDVKLLADAKKKTIRIRLGRVAPVVKQGLLRKLGKGVVSDFFEISGENYDIKNVVLSIPLKYSRGKNIELLRYDEKTRNFYSIPSTVDLVNQRVDASSPYKGIFVVVSK